MTNNGKMGIAVSYLRNGISVLHHLNNWVGPSMVDDKTLGYHDIQHNKEGCYGTRKCLRRYRHMRIDRMR